MDNNWKSRQGVVYSTNPEFTFSHGEAPESELLPPEKQQLYIAIDRKQRNGKTVTLITGFSGPEDALLELAKSLKQYCPTGGSAKDGEIYIQGEFREKIKNYLLSIKYKVKLNG